VKCPTCDDASEDRCCRCKGWLVEGEEIGPDPYAKEITGSTEPHLLCVDCCRRSAQDV